MDSDSEIYDHSTVSGRCQGVTRGLWRPVLASVIVFFAAYLLFGFGTPVLPPPDDPQNVTLLLGDPSAAFESFNPATGEYTFDGSEQNLVTFQGISLPIPDKLTVRKINISNTVLDAKALTDSLQGMTNIVSISVETSSIIGTFGSVVLPNIRDFNFSLYMHTNIDLYKPADVLKNMIFFEKSAGQSWRVEGDILNLDVNLSVWVWGTAVIVVNRDLGLVNVNTHYAQDILKWAEGDYSKLIVSWSVFNNISVVPPGLKYLNLNNAVPLPEQLALLLKRTAKLEQLHLFQPYLDFDEFAPSYYVTPDDPTFQNALDISQLPATLRVLSAARMGLTLSALRPSLIQGLHLEECNVTDSVLDNFQAVFSSLKSFSLFNAGSLPYAKEKKTCSRLLESVLFKSQVTQVVITRLAGCFDEDSGETSQVSKLLTSLGVGTASDVLLTKGGQGASSSVAWQGRALTANETDYYRFVNLAFDDVDTFKDYLHYDSAEAVSGAGGVACSQLWLCSNVILVTVIGLINWM